MIPVDITECNCPHCGFRMQKGVANTGKGAYPGAPAICVNCGGWLQMDDKLAFIKADAETMAKMETSLLALMTRQQILEAASKKVGLN